MAVDMGYAVVEMALENDELPPEQVLAEGASMLRAYVLDGIGRLS